MTLRSPLVTMTDFLFLHRHFHHLSFGSVRHRRIKCTCLNLGVLESDPEVKRSCRGLLKVLAGEAEGFGEDKEAKLGSSCSLRWSSGKQIIPQNAPLLEQNNKKKKNFLVVPFLFQSPKVIFWRSQMEAISSKECRTRGTVNRAGAPWRWHQGCLLWYLVVQSGELGPSAGSIGSAFSAPLGQLLPLSLIRLACIF